MKVELYRMRQLPDGNWMELTKMSGIIEDFSRRVGLRN